MCGDVDGVDFRGEKFLQGTCGHWDPKSLGKTARPAGFPAPHRRKKGIGNGLKPLSEACGCTAGADYAEADHASFVELGVRHRSSLQPYAFTSFRLPVSARRD